MLLFADSFEHYGTTPNNGRDAMLRGLWAQFDISGGFMGVTTDQKRTGSYSFRMEQNINNKLARFVFGGSGKVVSGVGFGIYLNELPTINTNIYSSFMSLANGFIVSIAIQSDGSLAAYLGGSGGTLIAVSDSLLTAGAFYHIESKLVVDPVVGDIEIRVNGNIAIKASNINTGSTNAAGYRFSVTGRSGSTLSVYLDDVFAWDDIGDFNNDFLGPQRLLTVYANGEISPYDWTTVGAASPHEAIDEVPPDGDTSYIGANDYASVIDFTLPTLPPEIDRVYGIFVPAYAKLDEAGLGDIQVSLVSGSEVLTGGDPATLGTDYVYKRFTFDYDPDTDAQITKAAFEAAKIRLEKTL